MPSPEIGRGTPRANSEATFGDDGREAVGPLERPNSPGAPAFKYEERERNPSIQTVQVGPVPDPRPGAIELRAQDTGPANIPSPRRGHAELYGSTEGVQRGLSDRSSSRANSPKGLDLAGPPKTTRFFGVSRSRRFCFRLFVTGVVIVIIVIVTGSIVGARCSHGRCKYVVFILFAIALCVCPSLHVAYKLPLESIIPRLLLPS